MEAEIRPASVSDWEAMRTIYLDGISTGQATFETLAPDWNRWDASHLAFGRLVAMLGETLVGWAALSPVSTRLPYAGVAEVSVYVIANHRGQGIGRQLLERLIVESEKNGIWMLQASVFPENTASTSLHKLCGFREVGVRERIGKLLDEWRDTVLLERRSKRVGWD